MKLRLEKKTKLFYFVSIVLLITVLGIFYANSKKEIASSKKLLHAQEVISKNNEVLLDVLNIETGFRGYLLSGNKVFLEPYYQSKVKVNANLDTLEMLTRDNPNQLKNIALLKKKIDDRLDFTEKYLAAKSPVLLSNSEKIGIIEEGKIITDKIRTAKSTITNEESRLLKYRKIENENDYHSSELIFLLLLIFLITIFILGFLIIKSQKAKNNELESHTADLKLASHYSLSLIEASLDPLVTISIEGKIMDMNQALVNITGLERKKLVGSDFFNYFTEPQMAREVYQKVFAIGSVADSPLTIRHKEGKLTDVLFNGSVYKDEKGKILGVVIVARDIAEQKWALDLRIANKELAFQNEEKEKRANELSIANDELAFQNKEKEKRANELSVANEELACQYEEKENRAAELIIANEELAYQNVEKENRAAELIVANEELEYQNKVKEKRAAALIIANKELAFQNKEKENRAAELDIANKELAFQNDEKEKRAAELAVANQELAFQNDEKEKRAAELIVANQELHFQNDEKEKRAAELAIANEELLFQNDEKEKRAAELVIANKELAFQNDEKGKRANELIVANEELAYQNDEKENRASELIIANKELKFQSEEKKKRADELIVANEELAYQNDEKENRASELIIANKELDFQNIEKEKREIENKELEALNYTSKLASEYSLSLIEASLDPLVTINNEGKITDMNQATVNITGMKREELTGSDFFKYFTEPQMAREVYLEVFAKGSVSDSPLTLRHKDGQLTDVLFNGSVYKDEKGNVLGVVIVARDVTDQKRIEKELIEAKVFAELATEIAEQAQTKAESATKIAEDAVKAKQQFLSNMSHEIRTPMNAIIGFTKVVLKTDLSTKQKEYLSAIKMSGDALIVLINDILDLAKVDAGKMVFEQVPFKMEQSIKAMLHVFETKIQEKNLELVSQYDSSIPEVLLGDSVRLHQIILNLVSNAVKFTTEGKITVSVRLLDQDDEKVTIEFAVSDTGIGIPENKMATIFENFQQASSGTSRLYGGTGLGLAIVKQLVEPQGGTITVKSKLDEGSTFSFILDFAKTDADTETDVAILELDSANKDIKVLVVEDMALNQLLMKTLLDDFGFERDIADNGQIAIEKLKTKSFDVILMDLQMPIMNGFEATEYIRNTLKLKIPIIALTADVTTVDLAKCKAVGMNDYIAKPVDERLLYNKIIGLVKKTAALKVIKPKIKISNAIKKIKCIDLDYLKHRTKSNPKLMMEMISLYLMQTPPLISTMKQSLLDKDFTLLRSSMHKMIPSFSIMGISPDFENMARKIQEYADAQQLKEGVNEMATELEDICEQACDELEIEFNLIKNTIS
ncbi:PAS domain S-box protein [Flavobacterium sp.]|uniref:PAS domain S-box protein n=1 Tax=Flavobacterium sp. TaxID=239 RepID=UPI003752F1B2